MFNFWPFNIAAVRAAAEAKRAAEHADRVAELRARLHRTSQSTPGPVSRASVAPRAWAAPVRDSVASHSPSDDFLNPASPLNPFNMVNQFPSSYSAVNDHSSGCSSSSSSHDSGSSSSYDSGSSHSSCSSSSSSYDSGSSYSSSSGFD